MCFLFFIVHAAFVRIKLMMMMMMIGYFWLIQKTSSYPLLCSLIIKYFGEVVLRPPRLLRPEATAPPSASPLLRHRRWTVGAWYGGGAPTAEAAAAVVSESSVR